MAKYSITSQADLQRYLLPMTASDTAMLANDITLDGTWTPIGTFAGTLDGMGHKISGMTARVRPYMTKANGNPQVSFTPTSYGSTYSYGWWQPAGTGTGEYFPIGKQSTTVNGASWNSNHSMTPWAGNSQLTLSWNMGGSRSEGFYVVVVTTTNVTIYKNGVSRGTKALINGVKTLTLSDMMFSLSGTWTGGIRGAFVTTTALTQADVTRLYNSGNPIWIDSNAVSGLVNSWNFDEGTGTSVADNTGGNTASTSGTYGWSNIAKVGGLFNTVTSTAIIKNITIDTPTIDNTVAANGQQGVIANNGAGATYEKCYVKDVTITAVYADSNMIGGLIGYSNGAIIRNCRVDVASIPKTMQGTTGQTGWSGGMIGFSFSHYIDNCCVIGTNTTTKPDCGFVGEISAGNTTQRIKDCWISMPVDRHVAQWSVGTYSIITNLHYNDLSGVTIDNKSSTGTIVANVSDFYDITQAPMNLWDFTYNTGFWSKKNDGTAFPLHITDFNADISGTVAGYSSGKDVTLAYRNKAYRLYNSAWGGGTLSASLTLGYVHTIAWTSESLSGSGAVIRKASSGDTGILLLNGSQWKYGVTGIAISKSIAPAGYSATKHRYVVARNGDSLDFYIDGTKVQTTTGFGTYPADNWDALHYWSTGYIDELVMTNDYKDQAWVTADYAKTTPYVGTEAGVIHLWHFEENPVYPTATTATDAVGGLVATFGTTTQWVETTDYPTYTTDTVTTTGSGDFTFSDVSAPHGTPILIYIDGEAVKGGTASTVTEGTDDITGVTVEQGAISIGDAQLEPNMTQALMILASAYPTTDTLFRTDASRIYYRDGVDAIIPTGCTYTGIIQPDTSETGDIIVDGTASLSGTVLGVVNNGTLTFTTGTITGDITNTGTWNGSAIQLQVHSPNITNSGTMNLRAVFTGDKTFSGDIGLDSPYFVTAGATHTFGAGNTYTYNTLTIVGALGNETVLQSDTAGSRFTLAGGGASLSYLDVKDCEADTADIFFTRSINSGGTDYREATPHCVFLEYVQAFITEHN